MKNSQMNCGHEHCGKCCGGGCSGCGGSLELTQKEIDFLYRFSQLPFLPVARGHDGETPVCLEDGKAAAAALSPVITALSLKGLIQVDYALPLQNFNYKDYVQYPDQGSMALTERGQRVLELLEVQGI